VTGLAAGLLGVSLTGCAAVAGVREAPTATVGGAVQSAQAQAIAAQVVGDAAKAAAAGPEGEALRASAYTGDALEAAKADAKLAATLSQEARDASALTTSAPVVHAVSDGLSYPRSMIVQTTRAKSGLPVLYLLTTPDVRTPYRIAASTPMLPSASVRAFDPVAQGSPRLGDARGLVQKPEELATAYAASLAFPPPAASAEALFEPDAFAEGIRASATSQNQGLTGIGTFTRQHAVKNIVGGLRVRGDAGALVFAVLERTDTFVNKSTGTITPSAQFTALTGLPTIKDEARLQTLEFVTFFAPKTGKAVVVGAEEHLYAASGT
jgi:hypothetical protein